MCGRDERCGCVHEKGRKAKAETDRGRAVKVVNLIVCAAQQGSLRVAKNHFMRSQYSLKSAPLKSQP